MIDKEHVYGYDFKMPFWRVIILKVLHDFNSEDHKRTVLPFKKIKLSLLLTGKFESTYYQGEKILSLTTDIGYREVKS